MYIWGNNLVYHRLVEKVEVTLSCPSIYSTDEDSRKLPKIVLQLDMETDIVSTLPNLVSCGKQLCK